jgi:hypothetical protein
MHVRPNYLLVSLLPPARAYLSEESFMPSGSVQIDGTEVEYGYPPGLALPDILLGSDSRTFLGVSFHVARNVEHYLKTCERFDNTVAHLNDLRSPEAKRLYPGLHGEGDLPRLEVLWAKEPSLTFESAQLDCVRFYFTEDAYEDASFIPIVAMEVCDLQDVLADFGLSFPSQLPLPPLDIEHPS